MQSIHSSQWLHYLDWKGTLTIEQRRTACLAAMRYLEEGLEQEEVMFADPRCCGTIKGQGGSAIGGIGGAVFEVSVQDAWVRFVLHSDARASATELAAARTGFSFFNVQTGDFESGKLEPFDGPPEIVRKRTPRGRQSMN